VFATASTDNAGNWAAVFDPVPLGFGWFGTISVPLLGASQTCSILMGSKVIGTIPGPTPWGPIAALGGERITLTATGLTENTVYQGVWIGIISDSLSVEQLIAPLPAVAPLGGSGPGGTVTANQGTAGVSAWPVSVSNFPATQPISGTVAATQSGSWSTGRTWVLASGTDSVTAVISGSVTVTGTVAVSGTVAVTQSTSPWVVSGTVTATPPALPTTPLYGRTVIATGGTPVAGPNKAITNGAGFIVQALSGNANSVYVGDSAVTSANGFELQPGQATSVALANMNELYVNGASVGDGVCFIGS